MAANRTGRNECSAESTEAFVRRRMPAPESFADTGGIVDSRTPPRSKRPSRQPRPRGSVSRTWGVRSLSRAGIGSGSASAILPSPQVSVEMDQLPSQGPAEKLHFTTYFVDHTLPGKRLAVDYTLQIPEGSNLEIRNPQGTGSSEFIHGDTSVDSLGGTFPFRMRSAAWRCVPWEGISMSFALPAGLRPIRSTATSTLSIPAVPECTAPRRQATSSMRAIFSRAATMFSQTIVGTWRSSAHPPRRLN